MTPTENRISSAAISGVFVLFFFFHAEDGIRDGHVTGVQTCALPICRGVLRRERGAPPGRGPPSPGRRRRCRRRRSEERRVGKECGSRGAAYHQKKNSRPDWMHAGRSAACERKVLAVVPIVSRGEIGR